MHESFISQLYQNILGREPDASGLAFWQEMIQYGGISATKMTEQFISSTEYRVLVQPVARLYFVSFDRAPEADGLRFWIEAFRQGATLGEIAAGFESSNEFQAQYGQMTDEAFVVALYQNTLRREPDESGQAYWLEQLSAGLPRAGVLSSFSVSAEMIELRSQEVDFALLYLALTGVPPTMAMIQQAVPIRDWAELIEAIYTGPDYAGVDVPGLVRFDERETPVEPPAETPDESTGDTSPEPDPGPAPDTTAPSILAFTVASPTTLSVTSSKSAFAALFREAHVPDFPDEVISGTEIEIANAGQAYPIVVSPGAGETFLKLADQSGNVTESETLVFLGSDGVEHIHYGGSDAAFIFGFGGDDFLSGGSGDDFLIGGDGNDTLTGGLGNDTFLIDSDSDRITDLSDSDVFIISVGAYLADATISSSYLATAASQNLGGTRDNGQFAMASGVSIANFAEMSVASEENGGVRIDAHAFTAASITGSSGSDLITGSSAADSLVGGAGGDILNGGDGNDTITGGAGADVLDGGEGDDLFLFGTGDVVTGEMIEGGGGVNTIRVVTSTDFSALATATILTAGKINNIQLTDTTTGTFLGSQLSGQAINVNYYLGPGSGFSTLEVNVIGVGTVDLTSLTFNATDVGTTTELISGTDIIDIDGDALDNTMTGTTLADNMSGNDGNDTITGGAGADVLDGGDGDDVFVYTAVADLFSGAALVDSITGGTGTDTVRMDMTAAGYTIAQTDSWHRANTIEVLSHFGANANNIFITLNPDAFTAGLRTVTLAGDTDANGSNIINAATAVAGQDLFLIGSAGVDEITGGAGNDTIQGGAGSDNIDAGAGANVVTDAGVGLDVIEHTAEHGQVAVTVTGSDLVVVLASQVGASVTIANGINGQVAAYVSTAGVVIDGGDGDDQIDGGLGDDTITGGAGANLIDAGAGANMVTSAGIGFDQIRHYTSGATVDITVTGSNAVMIEASELGASAAISDGINGAVDARFSTAALQLQGADGNDSLVGGSSNDILNGAAGNDTIQGGDGNDTITGDAGADLLTGGAGADTFVYAMGSTGLTFDTVDTITDFVTGVDLISTGITATAFDERLMIDLHDDTINPWHTTFDRFIMYANGMLEVEGMDVSVVINAGGSGNAWVAMKTNPNTVGFGEGDSIIILNGIDNVNKIARADFIT